MRLPWSAFAKRAIEAILWQGPNSRIMSKFDRFLNFLEFVALGKQKDDMRQRKRL